jgi:GntR family transcriptional regulator/MocR family aminotransferase
MPRRATSLPLVLPPRPRDTPAYVWLYREIRAHIVNGRLEPGRRLPSTRDLAGQYDLSRGTAVTAFEMLLAEGYLESASGSGTRVSQALPGARAVSRDLHKGVGPARRLSAASRRLTPFRQHDAASSKAFRANQPALDLFPTADWARAATRTLRHAPSSLLVGGDARGYRPLRSAIAEYLAVSRGVACDADRVVVVSGMQEALALTATVLVNPGDRVHVEDPGYVGAARVMQALGARLESVAIDDDGARVPATRTQATLAYLTPAHQFPLAVSMTMARRQQWLAWAPTTGAVIFEDDYDSEFRYAGHPVSALQGLDRDGVVLFAGSFSKVLCPSLRIGYLVLPPDLVDPFSAALSVMSRQASPLSQAILARFIDEGHFARHLRRMRDVYAERHAALIDGARRWLQGRLDVRAVNAGLQTVGLLAPGHDGADLAGRAAEHDVEVAPLARHARSPLERNGVQMGFAAVPPDEIARGVQVLARLLDGRPLTREAPPRSGKHVDSRSAAPRQE